MAARDGAVGRERARRRGALSRPRWHRVASAACARERRPRAVVDRCARDRRGTCRDLRRGATTRRLRRRPDDGAHRARGRASSLPGLVSPRLALIIGAIQSFAFGLPLLLFPATVLQISGLALPDAGAAIARGAGATVVGLGVIDWMLRDVTGPSLRGLLGGNLAVQVLSLFVNGGE